MKMPLIKVFSVEIPPLERGAESRRVWLAFPQGVWQQFHPAAVATVYECDGVPVIGPAYLEHVQACETNRGDGCAAALLLFLVERYGALVVSRESRGHGFSTITRTRAARAARLLFGESQSTPAAAGETAVTG